MKKILFFSAIALLVFATVGCEKDEPTTQDIIGTWKCTGFGNTETNEVRPIEPTDCNECYVLTFKKDGTLDGRSCANDLQGRYVINGEKLKFINVEGSEVGEMGDCLLFYEALPIINSYEIEVNKLHLYYSDNKYLLFEHKNK